MPDHDLTLFLLRDADEPDMWIDRWALGYPVVQTLSCARDAGIARWQQQVRQAFAGISGSVMTVAHGAGVSALMAWQYRSSLLEQRRVRGMILVSPLPSACPDDAEHTFLRSRANCPAALVLGRAGSDPFCPEDWAAEMAARWGARLLHAPQPGRLNTPLNGWQWGMKLMQEMLLA